MQDHGLLMNLAETPDSMSLLELSTESKCFWHPIVWLLAENRITFQNRSHPSWCQQHLCFQVSWIQLLWIWFLFSFVCWAVEKWFGIFVFLTWMASNHSACLKFPSAMQWQKMCIWYVCSLMTAIIMSVWPTETLKTWFAILVMDELQMIPRLQWLSETETKHLGVAQRQLFHDQSRFLTQGQRHLVMVLELSVHSLVTFWRLLVFLWS